METPILMVFCLGGESLIEPMPSLHNYWQTLHDDYHVSSSLSACIMKPIGRMSAWECEITSSKMAPSSLEWWSTHSFNASLFKGTRYSYSRILKRSLVDANQAHCRAHDKIEYCYGWFSGIWVYHELESWISIFFNPLICLSCMNLFEHIMKIGTKGTQFNG
jgi:hypothetical protein